MFEFSSPEINNIVAAMLKAQQQIRPVVKNEVNGFLHNKYASLAAILDAVRQPLLSNSILLIQRVVDSEPNTIAVETRLIHESGQWFATTTTIPMPIEETRLNIGQIVGATISYARRYGLMSMLSMAAVDEDTDGEYRTEAKPTYQQTRTVNPQTANNQTNFGLKAIPNVSFEISSEGSGQRIIIAKGATISNRDTLKSMGFRWDATQKTWWLAQAI